MKLMDLSEELTESLAETIETVKRSLVIVHNGREGAGAGVVWRQGGYIVTNFHVVARGKKGVTLMNGEECTAEIIAQAPEIDLALLRVNRPDLPAAEIADSRALRVGQIALAIGHPWRQPAVVTGGVISSLGNVAVKGRRQAVPVIRTDAGLAPGNSGGPLLDAGGGIIGINTMIIGGDLGVAIPSEVVQDFVSESLDRKSRATDFI